MISLQNVLNKVKSMFSAILNKRRIKLHQRVAQFNVSYTPVCLIDEQGLISAKGGIYHKNNKRTGPNHYYTVVPT